MKRSLNAPPKPTHRLLRGYAFDPSLSTNLGTALVSKVTYKIPWEDLGIGPRGEYIEVVDFDPASGCWYAPVDLNHQYILAQNGLPPREGLPQFHQQMVYAVAMTTIERFERALGRKAFWADHTEFKDGKPNDSFVQRLRIYPHAFRGANAYYSRNRGALLFGYFPAVEDSELNQLPGGTVFTCLSHDIVAHETTHALLDGFHDGFMEATNRDVLAFHEAFADIIAMFQHFSFTESVAHQIAQTGGRLDNENLLGQLATQFGNARGMRGALRDAIGRVDPQTGKWRRKEPDPTEYQNVDEVHDRGAILVAAVFDAFLSIYMKRTKDLFRLASGGTGVLPKGDIHPDLVNRLTQEAATVAGQVLNICIRALDYCPPVDLTFGEYLRAVITADIDLVPDDKMGYRVAFIEAFRRRGIYPSDVNTMSEDSLRWAQHEWDSTLSEEEISKELKGFSALKGLQDFVCRIRSMPGREDVWKASRDLRIEMHETIVQYARKNLNFQRLAGLALDQKLVPKGVELNVGKDGKPTFYVSAIREARRETDEGHVLNQVFITILQRAQFRDANRVMSKIVSGSTIVLDLNSNEIKVRYVVNKGLRSRARVERVAKFQIEEGHHSLASTYMGNTGETFAALHHIGA